jgi:hypothetical protein
MYSTCSLQVFDRHARVSEVRLRHAVSAAHSIYAPLKKCLEVQLLILLVLMPSFLYEGLQHSEKLLDGVKIWRVGRQIEELYSCRGEHSCATRSE